MRSCNWLSSIVGALALAVAADRRSRRASSSSTARCRRSGAGRWSRAFEKATGIKVLMTRKSSGEFYAQIKAEAANPRGDIWWGGTGDPHLQAAEEGLTEAYKSPKLAELQDWAVRQWEQSKVPDGRRLCRRAGLQLQHRAAEEEEHSRAQVLVGPHQAAVSRTKSRSRTRTRRELRTRCSRRSCSSWARTRRSIT